MTRVEGYSHTSTDAENNGKRASTIIDHILMSRTLATLLFCFETHTRASKTDSPFTSRSKYTLNHTSYRPPESGLEINAMGNRTVLDLSHTSTRPTFSFVSFTAFERDIFRRCCSFIYNVTILNHVLR